MALPLLELVRSAVSVRAMQPFPLLLSAWLVHLVPALALVMPQAVAPSQ